MSHRAPWNGTLVLLAAIVVATTTAASLEPSLALGVGRPAAAGQLDTEVARLARQFLARREMGPFLGALPEAEAYRLQRAFVARLAPTLGAIVGYKTGGHDSGPPNPNFPPGGIRGVLLEGMLRPSGSTVRPGDTVWGFLEADFALRVGDDSINGAETDLEILAGLDAVVPFLEIPDPAFEGNARSPTGSIVTNMASRYAFTGAPIAISPTAEWLRKLDAFTFAVHDERGTQIGAGTMAGHYEPLRVVRWLRDRLAAAGVRLEPGHLLSLGNIGISRHLKPGSPLGGPAYPADEFRLSYYGLADEPATVVIRIER